jgi:hypothetical protein
MVGTPGRPPAESDETPDEVAQTVQLARRIGPDVLTVTLTTPLPGTPLHARVGDRLAATTEQDFNYYDVWPGKYPVRLETLNAEQLAAAVAQVRRAWKRQLPRTVFRLTGLALRNGAFRRTVAAQAVKVLKRKVLPD